MNSTPPLKRWTPLPEGLQDLPRTGFVRRLPANTEEALLTDVVFGVESFGDLVRLTEKRKGAIVYIEARPEGRPEGSAINDYVVEDRADNVLSSFRTQAEAIKWAKKREHLPLVARVRHLNDKKNPDHWRAV
jgi:hypothetical protein